MPGVILPAVDRAGVALEHLAQQSFHDAVAVEDGDVQLAAPQLLRRPDRAVPEFVDNLQELRLVRRAHGRGLSGGGRQRGNDGIFVHQHPRAPVENGGGQGPVAENLLELFGSEEVEIHVEGAREQGAPLPGPGDRVFDKRDPWRADLLQPIGHVQVAIRIGRDDHEIEIRPLVGGAIRPGL